MPSVAPIERFALGALNVPLKADFRVASAALGGVANAWLALGDGAGRVGWGEIAVLPPITNLDQAQVLASAPLLADALLGLTPAALGAWQGRLTEALGAWPALLAAAEMAMLDLMTQASGISLWRWFGARESALCTDITIPIVPESEVSPLMARYRSQGFTSFKVKVGEGLDADLARVAAVHAGALDATLIIDANAAYSLDDALNFIAGMRRLDLATWVFEQAVAREDVHGMARLKTEPGVLVIADESVRNITDLLTLIRTDAVHGINLKIAKSGVLTTLHLAQIAQAAGLKLMIGGMVETRLAMNLSAQLAAGLGGFSWCDLDTPLLMAEDPVQGGYAQVGPDIRIATDLGGHGACLSPSRIQQWIGV